MKTKVHGLKERIVYLEGVIATEAKQQAAKNEREKEQARQLKVRAKEDQERQEREEERKLREEERKQKIEEDRKIKQDDRKRLRDDINKNVSAVLETTGKAQKAAANKARVNEQQTSPRRQGKASPSPSKASKKGK